MKNIIKIEDFIFMKIESFIIVIYTDYNNNKIIQYTMDTIINMPICLKEVYRIMSMNIWYNIEDII